MKRKPGDAVPEISHNCSYDGHPYIGLDGVLLPRHWDVAYPLKLDPQCSESHESPVDIVPQAVELSESDVPLHVLCAPVESHRTLTLCNNGRSVTLGGAGQLVAQVSGGDLGDRTYLMHSMHLHWGRGEGPFARGAEHTVAGHRAHVEGHFVCHNRLFRDLATAIAVGRADALLVVGVLFEAGDAASEALEPVIAGVRDGQCNYGMRAMVEGFDLSALLRAAAAEGCWRYNGSLTTPNKLDPVVSWAVMRRVLPLSWAQLAALQDVTGAPRPSHPETTNYVAPNFRPLQPLGHRSVSVIERVVVDVSE